MLRGLLFLSCLVAVFSANFVTAHADGIDDGSWHTATYCPAGGKYDKSVARHSDILSKWMKQYNLTTSKVIRDRTDHYQDVHGMITASVCKNAPPYWKDDCLL